MNITKVVIFPNVKDLKQLLMSHLKRIPIIRGRKAAPGSHLGLFKSLSWQNPSGAAVGSTMLPDCQYIMNDDVTV